MGRAGGPRPGGQALEPAGPHTPQDVSHRGFISRNTETAAALRTHGKL